MGLISLTMICSLAVLADKRHVPPRLNLVNVAHLNKVLRSEVFVSEDRQLRVVHLILDFESILDIFQEVGHVIKVGDPRLRRIDIFVPSFLAWEDLPLVKLPLHRALLKATAPTEEIASSHLSLDEEIDQFQLKEEKEEQEAHIIHVSDVEDKFDRFSGVCTSGLVVTCVVDNSKEEEEEMALNSRKVLRDLMARVNIWSSSKEVYKSQIPANLPLPSPPPITTLSLLPILNLSKKKRKEQEVEEGELVPQKEAKQQKTAKEK